MHRCLSFKLGSHKLGLDVRRVVEVMNPGAPEPVPEMPAYILGVKKLRGDMVPIIDLRVRMGVDPKPSKERTIVVRSMHGKVGFVVDDVDGILIFEEGDVMKPPVMFRGLKKEYMIGLYGESADVMVVLDIDEILSTEEKIELEHAMEKVTSKGRR